MGYIISLSIPPTPSGFRQRATPSFLTTHPPWTGGKERHCPACSSLHQYLTEIWAPFWWPALGHPWSRRFQFTGQFNTALVRVRRHRRRRAAADICASKLSMWRQWSPKMGLSSILYKPQSLSEWHVALELMLHTTCGIFAISRRKLHQVRCHWDSVPISCEEFTTLHGPLVGLAGRH